MKKFLSVLIIILLISPQANALGMKSTMNKIMDSWLGENIEKVFRYWGYPDDERNIAGRKLYYWTSSKFVTAPAYTNATANRYNNTTTINGWTYGGGAINAYCNRMLEVNDKGKVIYWEWKGNDCPFTCQHVYKRWVNPDYLYQEKLNKKFKHTKWKSDSDEYDRTIEATKRFKESLGNQ